MALLTVLQQMDVPPWAAPVGKVASAWTEAHIAAMTFKDPNGNFPLKDITLGTLKARMCRDRPALPHNNYRC